MNFNVIVRAPQPYQGQGSQSTSRLTSTYPKTEANDHPVTLGIRCGQHIEFPSRCWLSRLGLSLQFGSYPYFSLRWLGTDPIHQPKIPPRSGDWTSASASRVLTTSTACYWIVDTGQLFKYIQNGLLGVVLKLNDFKRFYTRRRVGLGGLGVTYSPRDPRFAGSNPAEANGCFQDVKILSTSPPGGTLSGGSWVWDFRLVKEPQAWKNKPLCKI